MKWKKHILFYLVIFGLGGLLFFRPGGCPGARRPAGRPPDARVVDLALEKMPAGPESLSPYSFVLQAEVADTLEKRRQGLSGRGGLEPGHGMLYVYDTPQAPEFSEASTPFPLSVAFMKEDGLVAEIHKTKARDETPFAPKEPIKYALEVRQGWFEDRGIGVGAKFIIPPELLGPARPMRVPADTEFQHGDAEDTETAKN